MRTLYFNKEQNRYVEIHDIGNILVRRYVGNGYHKPRLQDKADTGLFYCIGIQGFPSSIFCCGEGTCPQSAIRDSINRTSERIARLVTAAGTLLGALS